MHGRRGTAVSAAWFLSWGLFVAPAARAGEPPATPAGVHERDIVVDLKAVEPGQRVQGIDARRHADGNELDEARARRDLLEMEVEADKEQLQEMLTVLKRTELVSLQGFADGPVLSSNDREDREKKIASYRQRLDEVRDAFLEKSKALSRERRRVADLEDRLGLAAVSPASSSASKSEPTTTPAGRTLEDTQRVLDLILKGMETWQRSTSPTPPPPPPPPPATADGDRPEDRPLKDADRLLDLIRRGVEAWQGR